MSAIVDINVNDDKKTTSFLHNLLDKIMECVSDKTRKEIDRYDQIPFEDASKSIQESSNINPK